MYFVIGLLLSVIFFISTLIIVKNGWTRDAAPLKRRHTAMFINKLKLNAQANIWPIVHSAWVVIVYLCIPHNPSRIVYCVYRSQYLPQIFDILLFYAIHTC